MYTSPANATMLSICVRFSRHAGTVLPRTGAESGDVMDLSRSRVRRVDAWRNAEEACCVAVEALSSWRSSRWLREGLVESLRGDLCVLWPGAAEGGCEALRASSTVRAVV